MEKKKKPLVCVCIPAYNAEPTIGKTLESLVNQSYSNIDIIIVDNNSSDKTAEIVNCFIRKHDNIKLIRYNKTVPSYENFDRCIEHCYGKYTCIFHSDDKYGFDIIEREVAFLEEHEDAGAVFSFANIINENDKIISKFNIATELYERDTFSYQELFPIILKYGGCFVTPSAMVRTKVYKNDIKKHQINKRFGPAFDVDVWIRILQNHRVGFIKKELMYYRMSTSSVSFRSLLEYKNTIEECMLEVLKFHWNDFDRSHYDFCFFNNLVCKVKLDNFFKAYVNGDWQYARELLLSIDKSRVSFKYKRKIIRYNILLLFKMPVCFRKMMIKKKFRGVLKNNYIDLDFLK